MEEGGPLPHQDQDLYLNKCDATRPTQLWATHAVAGGAVELRQTTLDPVNHGPICLNCPRDRCHGWTCGDPNGYFKEEQQPDGNITLHATGGGQGGWPMTACLVSLSCGIHSKVEMRPCAAAKNGVQLWHLDQKGLLHNRAVQSSQSMDLCLELATAAGPAAPVSVRSFSIDGGNTSALPHFWSACVGSSHGGMWLRSDWLKHLQMAHEMGGFHWVRGHGILDEDVQVYSETQTYYNAIRAYSNVLEVGMKVRRCVLLFFPPLLRLRLPRLRRLRLRLRLCAYTLCLPDRIGLDCASMCSHWLSCRTHRIRWSAISVRRRRFITRGVTRPRQTCLCTSSLSKCLSPRWLRILGRLRLQRGALKCTASCSKLVITATIYLSTYVSPKQLCGCLQFVWVYRSTAVGYDSE